MYDIIIIGGGASGLYCGLQLCKKYKILLLDDRDYLGGRIHSHKNPPYEIGAARYHNKQHHLCKLIKKYKLTGYPLSKEVDFIHTKHEYIPCGMDFFHNAIQDVLNKSKSLSKKYLQSITFKNLCKKFYSNSDVNFLIDVFGYKSEFIDLNAYEGCNTFSRDFGNQQYFVIGEGMGTLCEKMGDDIKKNKGEIKLNSLVTSVTQCHDHYSVKVDSKSFDGKKIIFAIKPHQMKQFHVLSPVFSNLNSVGAGKLLRIYATFPIDSTHGVWFKGMKRTTTNSFLRHIIPISEESGLIMISYTDGPDVDKFLKKKHTLMHDKHIEHMVMDECRKLFKDIEIPKPLYFKSHYWSHGAHFWKVGYDSDKIINEMIHPVRNIYTCGEGFSKKQAWVEGALESAELVIRKLL